MLESTPAQGAGQMPKPKTLLETTMLPAPVHTQADSLCFMIQLVQQGTITPFSKGSFCSYNFLLDLARGLSAHCPKGPLGARQVHPQNSQICLIRCLLRLGNSQLISQATVDSYYHVIQESQVQSAILSDS